VGFIDAYSLVALIANEPEVDEVDGILRAGNAKMPLVNLAEAIDVLQRRYGLSTEEISQGIDPLELSGVISFVTAGRLHALLAGSLRAAHYERSTRAVSLADSFLLAHALADHEEVVTSDAALAAVARAEGVEVVALPNTAGKRP
jgi:PIN domain nuclease of toxin-antitoxin system